MKIDLDAIRARLARNSASMAPLSSCRIWLGAAAGEYGTCGQMTIRQNGVHRKVYVDRLSYALHVKHKDRHGLVDVGELAPVRHSCRHGRCIEPSHLEEK